MTAFDQQVVPLLAKGLPRWRHDQMRAAYEVFAGLDEPTGAEEDWRYVNLELPFSELSPAVEPGEPLQPGPFVGAVEESIGHVLVVDGHVVEIDSTHLIVKRLAEIEERSLSKVPPDHNKFAAAHAAFASDGVFVDVPSGHVSEAPLVVEIQGVTPGTASFPQLSITVGENAEAQILVVYRSAEESRLLMVPNIDLNLKDGGRLRFVSVQSLDHVASSIVHQRMTLGRDATGRLGEVGLGGDFARLDLGVNLEGHGSSSEMVGLYFGEGSQTLDYRMLINHSGKNTSSDVFLKGAVEDDSQSVFTGLLRIEKDATRTSTFETNRNLVLSENAKANSVPNLEILCDDVICGHASSVGPLEEDSLYYLQSRGLSKQRAERLLIKGFFQEVIDRLPVGGIAAPVSEEVFSRFVHAQEEGRVA
ncbi:MAG: Fe-S cluster assembly protein SufD [Acidimicrobiia bacterium]